MIFGHWACTGIARRTVAETEPYAFLVAAAFLPDLLDKTANAVFGLPGRGFGHSLLFFFVGVSLAWAVLPRVGMTKWSVLIGAALWVSHLVGDLVEPKVLFWPLLGPLDPAERFGFLQSFSRMYLELTCPEMLVLDLWCCTVAIALWWFQTRKVRVPAPITRGDGRSRR